MQLYFSDAADCGKLYINYPMIESYQHLKALPDPGYLERRIPVSLQPGKKYKALVRDSFMDTAISHSAKLHDLLSDRFKVTEEDTLKRIVDSVLDINKEMAFLETTEHLLKDIVSQKDIKTAVYQIKDLVWKIGYVRNGSNYWKYMRNLFRQVILINIDKAYRVQYGKNAYSKCVMDSREKFNTLSDYIILHKQNEASRDEEKGYIWVLSTCIMLVADYNFKLITCLESQY